MRCCLVLRAPDDRSFVKFEQCERALADDVPTGSVTSSPMRIMSNICFKLLKSVAPVCHSAQHSLGRQTRDKRWKTESEQTKQMNKIDCKRSDGDAESESEASERPPRSEANIRQTIITITTNQTDGK